MLTQAGFATLKSDVLPTIFPVCTKTVPNPSPCPGGSGGLGGLGGIGGNVVSPGETLGGTNDAPVIPFTFFSNSNSVVAYLANEL